jgi:hypothetical protein
LGSSLTPFGGRSEILLLSPGIYYSGIKLFDVDTLTRIAHIDRPTGARPTLYPTISSLRPILRFETSSQLLVAWGDCLMSMSIRDSAVIPAMASDASASSNLSVDGGTSGQATASATTRRRTVECTMAWELDCVACGVVPLDEDHVVVLGLVPPLDESESDEDTDEEPQEDKVSRIPEGNDLEVQILSRKNGMVVYCDSLPMLKSKEQPAPGNMAEPASSYCLLSSYALTKMEDTAEAEGGRSQSLVADDFDISGSLFSGLESGKRKFQDSHLYWNLKSIMFDDEELPGGLVDQEEEKTEGDADSQSVNSDDYGFVVRSLPDSELLLSSDAVPPVMVVTSGSDVVLARMADVDDAVAHALSRNRRGLALRRALRHKRELRRYELTDLVNNYLQAVLRLPQRSLEDESPPTEVMLSLRRMKLAVTAMPVLLGGNVGLWERWAREFEGVPGALFMLRDYLPVRGKKL